MIVLTVNAGSSSVRIAALRVYEKEPRSVVALHTASVERDKETLLRDFLQREKIATVNAIAHRIVHGGTGLTRSCRLTQDVERQIRALAELAPLHNPVALAWIEACRAVLGSELPQIAVFDTAFF